MSRDFVGEMRALCEKAISDTEQPNPVVAQEIVDRLLGGDPELLSGWLLAKAPTIVCDYLRQIDHTSRGRVRITAPGKAFADAAARFEAGQSDAMVVFEARYVVNEDGARRRVADMTGPDHVFVAREYAESARTQKFLESVHRAVAKKVGDRKTSEVYTPEQYVALFDRTPQPAGKAAAA